MRISDNEFAQAAYELFQHARAFNRAGRCAEEVDVRLIHTPRDAHSSTAGCYLRLADTHDIVYQPSFQVPTLYRMDGSDLAPRNGQYFGGNAMWSYTEHPISGLPCLFLHPCNTAAIMDELALGRERPLLLQWLGIYNRLANLQLPPEFFATKTLH